MARTRFFLASDIGKKKLTQEISDFQLWNIRKIINFHASYCQREVVATTVKRLSFKTN